jgi:hypothetical protein
MTEAKAIMIEHGMSTSEAFLVDLIRRRSGEFSRGVVGAPFHGLCDRLQGQAPTGAKIVQGALLHALKEAGWTDMGRIKSREYDNRKHVFCASDMAGMSKSDLRRMVETT